MTCSAEAKTDHHDEPPINDRQLSLRVVTMPKETNQYGSVFGGVILSYIDQAGFVEARRHGNHRWVTASIERVDFNAPVIVGDIVNFYTTTTHLGRTSVRVCIAVESERWSTGQTIPVTTAVMTMVAVDETGRPVPYARPAQAPPAGPGAPHAGSQSR